MKPIVLITKMQGGGMETFCIGLLRAWVARRIPTTIYVSYGGGVRDGDVPIAVERICWNVRAKKSFLPLARWLRGRPNDPCLALSQELAVVLVLLKKFRLIRNPIYFRESDDVECHYGKGFKRIMRWLWPNLDGIIEQSRAGREATRRICNGRLPPCRVVRNIMSVPQESIGDFRISAPVRLACVASYRPKKRQDLLVDMLAQEGADDWRLTFWGDGERRCEVEKHVSAIGLSDRIRFNDWAADRARIYSSCDVVVIPSDYEGLPNVMLEAILAGKRVSVRATCTGARELLTELGIGETWPWRRTLDIEPDVWENARARLAEICRPADVASNILEFMGGKTSDGDVNKETD